MHCGILTAIHNKCDTHLPGSFPRRTSLQHARAAAISDCLLDEDMTIEVRAVGGGPRVRKE